MEIHHIQLAMPSGREEVARAFYSGVLGMEELPKPEELAARRGAWFRHGSLDMHLGVEEDFRPARKAHPGIAVSDIDEMAATLAEAGHAVVWDEKLSGVRRFYSSDPFGNRLEFLQPTE